MKKRDIGIIRETEDGIERGSFESFVDTVDRGELSLERIRRDTVGGDRDSRRITHND
jgi:hypothetical protein